MIGIYDSRGEEYTLAELRFVLREHGLVVVSIADLDGCELVQKTEERCDGAIVVTTFEGDK